jgi:hypothetical protein
LNQSFATALEGRYRLILAEDTDAATVAEAQVLPVSGLMVVTAELVDHGCNIESTLHIYSIVHRI